MLTKGSSNLGIGGDGVASSSIIGSFSNAFAVPGTSSHAAATNNNNNILDMDGFLGLAGGSSTLGDPISTFRPQLKDMELHRRARNNAILAKIQELEANACVQAARSERLRMMREEYESLVRKYASSRQSHWGTTSNGHFNENNNNGFPPSRYLQPFNSPQQHSYLPSKESCPPPVAQQLLSTTNSHPFASSSAHPTRDIPSNINRSFATTGVNTDITGPVQRVVVSGDDNAPDDLQQVLNLERRKVTAIKDSGSQTESHLQNETVVVVPQQQMGVKVVEAQCEDPQATTAALLLPSSSAVPTIYGTSANQSTIVGNGEDVGKDALSLKQTKNLPSKVEMLMMMLDDEDDESSYQAEKRRKQQFENFHQQLHKPKSQLRDDTNSISSPPSTSIVEVVSTSHNTTDEVGFKQRQRQMEKASAQHEKKYQKKGNNKDEMKDETSPDTTTISLANNNIGNNRERITTAADARLSEKIVLHEDISLSDSTSAFQTHKNEKERKKLLDQLVTSSAKSSHIKDKGKSSRISGQDADGDHQENSHNDSSEDEERERSAIRAKRVGADDTPGFSSPTAGATSESIGDSMMDSIQKTPDALLPRDDSELHEIAEVNEKEHGEQEEIEFAHKDTTAAGVAPNTFTGVDDDVIVVTATAVTTDTKSPRSGGGVSSSKPFRVQPGVNDKVSVEKKTRLKQDASNSTQGRIKELGEVHERQINDAEEIRPNNLSSSKVDVPAEQEENFTHANNPGEPNTGITTISGTTFQDALLLSANKTNTMEEQEEEKNPRVVAHEDVVEHSMDKELKNSGFVESPFLVKQIASGDSGNAGTAGGVNESNTKKSMILHSPAPSANMSAHSSSTSTFSSGSNVVDNGGTNGTAFPPSIPASTNLFQRHSSTGSSSTSSSRQHSLDDQGDGNGTVGASSNNNVSQTKEQSNSGSHHGSPQVKAMKQQQHQTPSLPQSVHKRHQQLQEQVRKEREEKETAPPVGADVMPERIPSSSDSSFSKTPALEAAATTSNIGDGNNGRKVSAQEKSGTSLKATKGSSSATPAVHATSTLTSSPSSSSKKIGNANTGNSNGNIAVGNNGSGGQTSIRSASASRSSKSPSLMMKQGQSNSLVNVPSGPTGAQNTARRVRLKLHEDSDTDSSEIGPVKSQSTSLIKGNLSGNKGNSSTSGGGQQPVSINGKNGGESSEKNVADKKPTEVDDDFDDFYDNF